MKQIFQNTLTWMIYKFQTLLTQVSRITERINLIFQSLNLILNVISLQDKQMYISIHSQLVNVATKNT
jgi:hypothetical protein